ncbi:hypothetical protein LIA77_05288 [Sarocladium implicatum]|nr:hypothetical protein LIA77_05288 [Sarocladium implicatum]
MHLQQNRAARHLHVKTHPLTRHIPEVPTRDIKSVDAKTSCCVLTSSQYPSRSKRDWIFSEHLIDDRARLEASAGMDVLRVDAVPSALRQVECRISSGIKLHTFTSCKAKEPYLNLSVDLTNSTLFQSEGGHRMLTSATSCMACETGPDWEPLRRDTAGHSGVFHGEKQSH